MHHRSYPLPSRRLRFEFSQLNSCTKSSKPGGSLLRLGQAMNLGVERFVSVGESIAADNPEIRLDMYDLCQEARAAAAVIERLCEVSTTSAEVGGVRLVDRRQLARAAKSLLCASNRILALTDSVVTNRIVTTHNKIIFHLNRLENVTNFAEFVKAFSHFAMNLTELASLFSGNRNDIREERRHAQIAVSGQLLERTAVLLITTAKMSLRHPECPPARESRDTVFVHMRRTLDFIHMALKDTVVPELAGTNEHRRSAWRTEDTSDQFITIQTAMKKFEKYLETAPGAIVGAAYRNHLSAALDDVLDRAQDFTDSAYTAQAHRERILILCDRAKLELNQLLRIGGDQTGYCSPAEELEASIHQVRKACHDLRQQLMETALQQAGLILNLRNEAGLLQRLKQCAISGEPRKVEDYGRRFGEHAEHVQEVCKLMLHVAPTESRQVVATNTEYCLSVFAPQVLRAMQILTLHPHSMLVKENADAFGELWISLVADVVRLADPNGSPVNPTVRLTLPPETARPSNAVPSQAQPPTIEVEQAEPTAVETVTPGVPGSSPDPAGTAAEGSAVDPKFGADSDIVRRAQSMTQMSVSMYQFTQGEGDVKTTQDLFTQAEFLAEEANKFYKVVRHFSYQVPGGPAKKELLESLDTVPTFVQQLQFTVKYPTVGKAATFTKVDNVLKEAKKLTASINKVVSHCLTCASKFNIDISGGSDRSRGGAAGYPWADAGEEGYGDSLGLPPKGVQSASDPNI